MKVIVKRVGESPTVEDVENKLEAFQELVGGYIEVVSVGLEIVIVCNEEGKIDGLPVNFGIGHDTINGTAVFVAHDSYDDFTDLSDMQLDFIMSKFYE